MIKLKDLLDVNKMKYSDSVELKHQKSINQKTEIISDDMRVPVTPFPENSSRESRRELEHLVHYNNGTIDEDMVKEGDDIEEVFESYCKDNDLVYDKDYYSQILKESKKTILSLKYYYNRPRPFQLAEFYNIQEFKKFDLPSMKTPSYPSGHSTQGHLMAELLGKKYPKHYDNLKKLADFVSKSRLMARAHYISDCTFGEEVAHHIVAKIK